MLFVGNQRWADDFQVKAPQEFPNQGGGQNLPDGSFGPEFNKNGGR
jgi:hypothetical protein